MKKYLLLLLVSSFLQSMQSNEICTVHSLEWLEKELPHLNENALVVFDRDDTVLQGIDCIDPASRKEFVALWKTLYGADSSDETKADLLTRIKNQKPKLVDEGLPSLVEKLFDRGVKVIGLTRGCHGESVVGAPVEDLSIEAFKKVGIELGKSFSDHSGLRLNSVNNNGNVPLFKEGILFSNTCDKGEALEAFLRAVYWCPYYIIFVDDKIHYIQEVQKVSEKIAVKFLGLHYRGAELLSEPGLEEQCYRMCYLLDRDLK